MVVCDIITRADRQRNVALTLEGEAIWFGLTTNYFLIDHDPFSYCFEQSHCSELRATLSRIFSALQVRFGTIQQA